MKICNRALTRFTLENSQGLCLEVIPYGAIMTRLTLPDRQGTVDNLVLGFDDLTHYLDNPHYIGATIGRVANRINQGTFSLNRKTYHLPVNNGTHHLHGGHQGFSRREWKATPFEIKGQRGVTFSYLSRAGEENYPGTLQADITYRLTDKNELFLEYQAVTDQETPVNLTHHAYWNLRGSGTIKQHRLRLNCPWFLPVTQTLIPTGHIYPVQGTPLDFTWEKPVGQGMKKMDPEGYDHCFVIDRSIRDEKSGLSFAARLCDPESGRVMTVYTDQPGIQLYTGNYLSRDPDTPGHGHPRHGGLCLETQNFPDAVNQPTFPSPFLKPGTVYRTTTLYRFSLSTERE